MPASTGCCWPGAARGLAAGTRPDRWGMGGRMADFTEQANAHSLVCVQIEHQEAVANIDEILAVDGIDVFFIGPSDLSQSMGHPGNPKAAPVAAAIATTLARNPRRRLPLHLHPPAPPARGWVHAVSVPTTPIDVLKECPRYQDKKVVLF